MVSGSNEGRAVFVTHVASPTTPSVVHDAAIEPLVRLRAQSRGHLLAAPA